MVDRTDKLLSAIEAQHATITLLTEHVGLLANAVAQLLGEEIGTPDDDKTDEVERDWDGNPIR